VFVRNDLLSIVRAHRSCCCEDSSATPVGEWRHEDCKDEQCRFHSVSINAGDTRAPFVGTNSETWERFGIRSIPSGTSILGGIATISGCCMLTANRFRMCSVWGVPSDGTILMDQDRPNDLVTISFSQPVSAFGAYWGSGVNCLFGDAASILTFQDVNGNVIGSDSFFYEGNGILDWHGYAFATPVKTITRTASDGQEGFAMDGLQATVASSSTLLGNISTRAFVQTGDNVMIGGLIVTGSGQKKVIVRAIGPSLVNHGITNPLQIRRWSCTITPAR